MYKDKSLIIGNYYELLFFSIFFLIYLLVINMATGQVIDIFSITKLFFIFIIWIFISHVIIIS